MGEAPGDPLGEALGEASLDTNGTQNRTNVTDGSLLPSDCSITTVTVGCCKVMTTITIVSATMETSTNFTCRGVNEEDNSVGLPEEDTVTLLVVGKLKAINHVFTDYTACCPW